MRIDVADLIERCKRWRLHGDDPATGVDCWWITREIVRRRWPDMPLHELPITDDEIVAAIELGPPAGTWKKVGETSAAASRAGDLVFGRRPEDGFPFTLGVVDDVARKCGTALPGIGACIRNTRDIPGIVAVYRRTA